MRDEGYRSGRRIRRKTKERGTVGGRMKKICERRERRRKKRSCRKESEEDKRYGRG